MKYMGSKNRFAKELLPIILKDRTLNQYYIEPFAGGMNLIDKVEGKRIANDIHTELIDMWKALVYENWTPPKNVSEELYNKLKNEKQNYPKKEIAYIGFNSYGGKYFRGFRRDNSGKRDYWREHYNNIMKQVPKLKGVSFINCSFTDLDIPKNSIIYCDPPYFGTEQYKNKFNHILFWDWCRTKTKEGHKVFISEYNAPDDFKCIWEKEHKTIMANGENRPSKTSTEKLYVYCG
jgi:DNA adenine methylase